MPRKALHLDCGEWAGVLRWCRNDPRMGFTPPHGPPRYWEVVPRAGESDDAAARRGLDAWRRHCRDYCLCKCEHATKARARAKRAGKRDWRDHE